MTEDSTVMTLWEHLDELRSRLLKMLIALAVGSTISFTFAEQALNFITTPVGGLSNLQSIEVTENISVLMKVSLLGGFILAVPVIFYQIIAFIAPGLKPAEKRWLWISLPLAFILFTGGVLFAYLVMLPVAIPFLLGILPVETQPRLSNYINFITNMMFWIGLSFETPLVILLLARLGLVTPGLLLRQWRIAVIISAVIAAVATPTVDPINMGLFMAPMMALYLLSILFAAFARKRPAK